jgi:hypothetical protein
MMFRIGIISDTHGLLRPEAERHLTGVDHIVHAGDIGRPEIVDALRRIAPVTAIRGNVDRGVWAGEYPETKVVGLAGKSIYVLHDLETLHIDVRASIDVIIPAIPTYRRFKGSTTSFILIPAARARDASSCRSRLRPSKSLPTACDRKSTILKRLPQKDSSACSLLPDVRQ